MRTATGGLSYRPSFQRHSATVQVERSRAGETRELKRLRFLSVGHRGFAMVRHKNRYLVVQCSVADESRGARPGLTDRALFLALQQSLGAMYGESGLGMAGAALQGEASLRCCPGHSLAANECPLGSYELTILRRDSAHAR